MAWVEGVVAPKDFVRELARILCTTNKKMVSTPVTGEALTTSDQLIYQALRGNWDETGTVVVYVDGAPVDSGLYMVDYEAGTITFAAARTESEVVTADYSYLEETIDAARNWELVFPDPDDYKPLIPISEDSLTPAADYKVYSSEHAPWDIGSPVLVFVDSAEFARYQPSEQAVTNQELTTLDQVLYSSPHTNWVETESVTVRVNGALISPTRQVVNPVTGEQLTTSDNRVYYSAHGSWDPSSAVVIKEDDVVVQPENYTVDYANGTITFSVARDPSAVITVDYSYLTTETIYTVNYAVGAIEFTEACLPEDRVTADYTYIAQTEAYRVDYQRGQIIFTAAQAPAAEVTASYTYIDTDQSGFNRALEVITTRTVLRTTTSPVVDELGVSRSLTMYLEIEKPEFIVNVDVGLPYVDDKDGNTVSTPKNYHGVRMRLISDWDYTNKSATQDAKVSLWSYLDWYRTYDDKIIDLIDNDGRGDRLEEGVLHEAVQLPATADTVPITYWGNADNDRVILAVLGAAGVSLEHALSSIMYVGSLESFSDSELDVEGNFTLTTSSSQVPTKPLSATIQPPEVSFSPPAMKYAPDGQNWSYQADHWGSWFRRELVGADSLDMLAGCHRYRVIVQRDDGGYTLPSNAVTVKWLAGDDDVVYNDYPYVNGKVTPGRPSVVWDPRAHAEGTTLQITVPARAKKVEIYRTATVWTKLATNSDSPESANEPPENAPYVLIKTLDLKVDDSQQLISFTDTTATPSPGGSPFSPPKFEQVLPMEMRAVKRDSVYRTISEVLPPDTWGENTATGVTDLCLYRTYRGEYYQRHDVSFITPGEGQIDYPFQASMWTGKFHVSPIVVTHFLDGERGLLRDCLAVFDRSIVYGDTIYIDKDTPQEKRYRFFRITAPYHFLINSPNPVMGIAIRMA